MSNENIQVLIKEKNDKLIQIGKELKKKFIGIDDVIDHFISSVRVWFVMPELMTRPLIINLWGLTGSGKTDLIRTFVKLSGMSSSFMEMQMDISSHRSIKNMMEYADVDSNSPYILLLDEFQRFKTKDEEGKDIDKNSMQDIWMLLSDGKFQSSSETKRELLDLLLSDLYYNYNEEIKDEEKDDKKENEKKKEYKYKMAYYNARFLKKILKSKESIEDIMKWDLNKKRESITDCLKNDEVFEETPYSKLLIVIAGNLDDAYEMATAVSNTDVDADVFHEHSKCINVVSIKNALLKRFKPEQVSRLGNNHIIYKSLNRDSYNRIIRINVDNLISNIFNIHKITIIPNQNVYETIYNNGVYPTQGVRPVISTISNIFENFLPNFLFKAIENNTNLIHVKYQGDQIVGEIGSESLSYKANLQIDTIKKEASEDFKTLVAVHEAGHALVYGLLLKTAPTQIVVNTANGISGGFVGLHPKTENKKNLKDGITINLAGTAAEEFVFGDEYKTSGSVRDIENATYIAASYIRKCGFDGFQSKIHIETDTVNSPHLNTNIDETNSVIEAILKEQKSKSLNLIKENKDLYSEIVQLLIDKEKISQQEFANLFEKYGIKISIFPSSKILTDNYKDKWQSFKNN